MAGDLSLGECRKPAEDDVPGFREWLLGQESLDGGTRLTSNVEDGMTSSDSRRRPRQRIWAFAAISGILSALLSVTPTSTASAAADEFGAIAWSPIKQTIGSGLGDSADTAKTAAMANCQRKGGSSLCVVVTWWQHGWGALATSSNGHIGYGWAWSTSSSDAARTGARNNAVSGCEKVRGVKCTVAFQLATSGTPGEGQGETETWGYAALGDSFSSGEGTADHTHPYIDGTNTTSNKCHRSSLAYPWLLNAHVSTLGLLRSDSNNAADNRLDSGFWACSGATTGDYFSVGDTGEPPQVTNLIGYQSRHNVRVVTLTLGGNDMHFADIMANCLSGDCRKDKNKAGLRAGIEKSFKALQEGTASPTYSIHSVLESIHSVSPDATIFVLGYPRMFGDNVKYYPHTRSGKGGGKRVPPTCHLPVTGIALPFTEIGITYANATYLNDLADRLNGVLANEVDKAKKGKNAVPARFISVRSAFTTHGLCDSDKQPWINAPRLMYTPKSGLTPIESFHPNATGQAQYEAIFRKTLTCDPAGRRVRAGGIFRLIEVNRAESLYERYSPDFSESRIPHHVAYPVEGRLDVLLPRRPRRRDLGRRPCPHHPGRPRRRRRRRRHHPSGRRRPLHRHRTQGRRPADRRESDRDRPQTAGRCLDHNRPPGDGGKVRFRLLTDRSPRSASAPGRPPQTDKMNSPLKIKMLAIHFTARPLVPQQIRLGQVGGRPPGPVRRRQRECSGL
jgi:hypothetical protein